MKNTHGIILVVDDNEINRKYVNTVLRGQSRTVHLAENGFEGLKLASTKNIDLALIDIQMPDMDGFECHNRMREKIGSNTPILAITAYSDPEDRDRFIRFGFNDYMTKPVKPEVLKNTVQYWLKESAKIEKKSRSGAVTPDFNLDTVEELKRYASQDELIELYNEFIEETNTFNQKLLFLQNVNDHTEILSILHTIKGNAGSLGFTKLSELVTLLESDLKNKIDLSLNERIGEIVDYTSEIFSEYATQLNLNL
ncbi:response regulator [Roseivirga sp. E12]|uniref:response regulator n=1 Tax=Roseivirga sp. E12 TaxID=2819237 RepID=UPI001ABD0DB7|nr:response regulator [Roseivirga sp. E12]MBO3697998.1 response regulator [Roseivirga sp. E12]